MCTGIIIDKLIINFKTVLMKFQKERLIFLICILISFFLAFLSWDYIHLKYTDPGIIGAYSLNNYHSFNDVFRYIAFVLIPIFTFIGVKESSVEKYEKIKDNLFATVKFVAEVISVKKDKENKIIEGNPDKIKFVTDSWKFTRNIKQNLIAYMSRISSSTLF